MEQEGNKQNQVELRSESLGALFGLCNKKESKYNLVIPDYQRIYSWEKKNVIRLLDDIKEYSNNKYHLGNIILHKKGNDYNIVDGQQRLVTFSLILSHFGKKSPLIEQTINSHKAQEYIAYNKWLINNYIEREKNSFKIKQILENITFSVLIISEISLDLAYTFFTSQNARGKSLTDYDLLKAHHLRYIYIPEQAKHLAERWDNIVLSSGNENNDEYLARTFGVYLFRLRKWMRKKLWSDENKYKVKNEFEAAPIIPAIPPFGEQFEFYETIQGGTHFFGYAEYFIHKYKDFSKLKEYKLLKENIEEKEKHWWYREIIEAFLFAYYLKFNTLYIANALVGIIKIISEHRYNNFRANLKSIYRFAGDTEIIMMIDQATSPTFFLAEINEKIKRFPKHNDLNGTRYRYNSKIDKIISELTKIETIYLD